MKPTAYRARHGVALCATFIVVAILVISMVFGILADRKFNEKSGQTPNNPTVAATAWDDPVLPELHKTCNGTHLETLKSAFEETWNVTSYAKSRLLAYGTNDRIYQRWFGDGNLYTVLGTVEAIAEVPKKDVLFRCDDADGLCAANPSYYAGHHRLNATQETVICDYFYSAKLPVSEICSNGTLAEVPPSRYMGIDMIHRYFHVPTVSLDEYIGEHTEEVDEILSMASKNSSFAVRNVDSYLYYLADVYSSAIVPGGCLGDL
ncbi:LAQU0S01e00122g1_1 [Lachancea quebecensis]|uniref:LAQU0S01e00122g1_1 n=1 Tax=Lachancea quebecensis TaxID=1654605 RepID=A0A0P1KL96_9SACH|nr:LAQU0S01e00122g1_1 [Lachancea quebecensis]